MVKFHWKYKFYRWFWIILRNFLRDFKIIFTMQKNFYVIAIKLGNNFNKIRIISEECSGKFCKNWRRNKKNSEIILRNVLKIISWLCKKNWRYFVIFFSILTVNFKKIFVIFEQISQELGKISKLFWKNTQVWQWNFSENINFLEKFFNIRKTFSM